MADTNLRSFGLRAREERLARKLTLEQVADRSGLHPTYVAGIESGKRNPTLISIAALAAGLGVQPVRLVEVVEATAK